MSRGNVHLLSSSFSTRIVIENISGSGGSDAPTINIPIEIEFGLLRNGSEEKIPFEVTIARADLFVSDKSFKVAETTILPCFRIYDNGSRQLIFSFLLSEFAVQRIEKYRKDNLNMTVDFQIQVALLQNVILNLDNGKTKNQMLTSSIEQGSARINFQIEQSKWIKQILPALGYKSFTLIELPAFNEIIPEDYSVSLKEFEEARKYYVGGDYDKTVAHCRAALDPFKDKEKLANLKSFLKSQSEFEWANKVLFATEEWLDKVIKATAAFSSKTHHAPSVGHFSRTEAEIVLMITTGIIAYIGKIEFKAE